MAEITRLLVEREAESRPQTQPDSLWAIAGLVEDAQPLLSGVPVSENPELYLTAAAVPSQPSSGKGRRRMLVRNKR